MTIVNVGVSHRFAPAEILEKLAVPSAELGSVLTQLHTVPSIDEVAVLSTCNRMEVYAAAAGPADQVTRAVASLVAARARLPVGEVLRMARIRAGGAAAEHLFSVACGRGRRRRPLRQGPADSAGTGLQVAAFPARENPRDALIWPGGTSLDALPPGARIGTGSPRLGRRLAHILLEHGGAALLGRTPHGGGTVMARDPGGSVLAPPGPRLTTTMAQLRPFLFPAGGQFGYRPAGTEPGRLAGGMVDRWPP